MFTLSVTLLNNTSNGSNKYYHLFHLSAKNFDRGIVCQNWGAIGRAGAGYGKTFYGRIQNIYEYYAPKINTKVKEGYREMDRRQYAFENAVDLRTWLEDSGFTGVLDYTQFANMITEIEAHNYSSSHENADDENDPSGAHVFKDVGKMKEGILVAHDVDNENSMRGSW